MDALGIGNIDVLVEVDQVTTSKTLTEVLYVPGLGSNLFSVGAATANGLVATFDDNKVIIFHAAFLIKIPKASYFFFLSLLRYSSREMGRLSLLGRSKMKPYFSFT